MSEVKELMEDYEPPKTLEMKMRVTMTHKQYLDYLLFVKKIGSKIMKLTKSQWMIHSNDDIIGIGNVPFYKIDTLNENYQEISQEVWERISCMLPYVKSVEKHIGKPFIFQLKSGLMLYVAPRISIEDDQHAK